MELARGVVIAGKYRLERPLATGGMGSVWVARHAQLDTPTAIKFMDPQSAASMTARARFEREAKASAALRNKHVVQVLDYGVESDTPYLVMELLEGEDLSKRIHRERRLPLDMASRILTQTAKGLRPAHDARVVHRDLKPANIFLTKPPDEDEEIVKVLDFGIAKDTTSAPIGEGTKTGELMGSPHYMSPEQVRGARDLDCRSDLWSLSVIMFRILTGKLPFNGDVLGAVIAQILADPIPVATKVAPDLPPSLDAFFARGFARDREERFQTAREMAEEFAAIVTAAGQPASARWTIVDEPPTRPRVPSLAAIEPGTAADLLAPPSVRPELASIPTDLMTPSSSLYNSGPLAGTGGPVIHSAPPPPMPRPSPLRWLPFAGAGAGVLIGGIAFLAVRSGGSAVTAAAGPAVSADVAPALTATASASPPVPSATAEASAAPASSASSGSSASAVPPPKASARPGAAPAGAAPSGTALPGATPAGAAPAKSALPFSPTAKKKPNWGF